MTPWTYDDDGIALVGELYLPTGAANGCAVLVVHEADGIGGNVRRYCAMLAELGYIAAAADLHGTGRVLGSDETPHMLDGYRREPERLRRRVGAALNALAESAGLALANVAAIGFCFGGWAVLELARSGAPLAAVASFHGLLTTSRPARSGEITARVLACTGALDPLVPPEDVAAFEAEMKAADADWQLIVHGRAKHSYTNVDVDRLNDDRMAYDEPAAQLSWSALLAHLNSSLA